MFQFPVSGFRFQVERPSNFDVRGLFHFCHARIYSIASPPPSLPLPQRIRFLIEIDNDRGQQPWKRAKMQSYRSRNRTSSLVEDLLVSALSHDGMETVEVRDLNAHEEAALIVTFANHGELLQLLLQVGAV
jgi:hypothetical protein